MSLADLLRRMDLVVEAELAPCEKEAAQTGEPLLSLLVKRELVDDELVARLLSGKLNLNRVDLDTRRVDPRALTMLPAAVAHRFRAVPVGIRRTPEGDILYVAMSNPQDPQAVQVIRRLSGMRILPLVATESAVERCLARHFPAEELTDLSPFSLLPPDETLRSDADVPVVVGELVSDGPAPVPLEEETLRQVRDSAKSTTPRGEAPAPVEEWLTASTQEVLDVYAPRQLANQGSLPTDEDLKWLSSRQRGDVLAPGETRVDLIGPTTLVCPDIGLREWMKEKLAGVVSQLREHPSLTAAACEDVPLANVILIHPENEPSLIAALKALRSREIPPRVYVVSSNKGFEVLGGVDVRIEPPAEDEAMAYAVLEALVPRVR